MYQGYLESHEADDYHQRQAVGILYRTILKNL